MPGRGHETREQLLDVAERLFGDRGIGNVSLREIRLVARQGNAAAVQYHFGDRAGVVRAIAERHIPRVTVIQEEYAARLDQLARPSLRARVEVLVRPLAEYITRGPSERAWAKMCAELLSDPRIGLDVIADGTSGESVKQGSLLVEELTRRMPAPVARERVLAVSQFAVHLCANRAKMLDSARNVRTLGPDADFADNLLDMAVGALKAPVHTRGERSLAAGEQRGQRSRRRS
jgi:AcrR family transcriptional regulator